MKFRFGIVVVSFLLAQSVSFADSSLFCSGNVCPDVFFWSEVFNPNGERAVPAVGYDPATGLLFIDTSGCNQTVDTTLGSEIGVDDVGMIAFSIESPAFGEAFLEGFIPSQYGGGVAWQSQYFAGKSQLFGVGAGSEYLDPAQRTDLFQFAPGLTPNDFGTIEVAINFATGLPGATLFGTLQFVPEPDGQFMMVFCLTIIAFARRNLTVSSRI